MEELKWLVVVGDETAEYVTADVVDLDSGCLIFKNHDKSLVKAFAPGTWITVEPVL